jgi:hypothetical protein
MSLARIRHVARHRDDGRHLVARLVLEDLRGGADDGFPEVLERVVLLRVANGVEHFQVSEQRLDIPLQRAFPGVEFDDQVEPSVLEVEPAVHVGKVIDLGHVKAEQPHRELERRLIRERVDLHLVLEPRVASAMAEGLDGRSHRRHLVADVAEVLDRRLDVRQRQSSGGLLANGAEVDGPVAHDGAVDLEREQVADDRQPRPAGSRSGLRSRRSRRRS